MKQEIKRKVLKNGITVVFEKRDLPIVSMAYAVRFGGVDESLEEKGIAHFIEHMLYKGTPTRDAHQIAFEIERKGGILNGFTDEQITSYWAKAPSKHLFEILDVLTDMVKNPKFDENEMNKERKVIFEEIKMRKDTPRVFVYDEIKNYLYEKPFGPALIGTIKTLSDVDRKKMIDKFSKTYSSNNLVFAIVGDADFEKICSYLEKNFQKKEKKISIPEIKLRNEKKILKRKGIDQANLVFAFHGPKAGDDLYYAAEVLMTLIAGGMSSRLFTEIREKRNLAYAVKGDLASDRDFGYFLVYVGTTEENVEKVKQIILEEFDKVSKSLDEKELASVKEQIIGNHLIEREDSQLEMLHLLYSEIAGKIEDAMKFEEKISKVKLEDVKKLAKIKDYSFLALVPE